MNEIIRASRSVKSGCPFYFKIMKIATFNTNSIRSRMGIIIDWIESEKPDILCLQETKVQDRDFPESQFEERGYQVAFRGQKAYNGVAIISKVSMEEIRRNLTEGEDEQARFISAKLPGYTVMNVYVPQGYAPGTDKFQYKLQWMKELLNFIRRRYDASSHLLLVGDFNVALEPIDLFDPEGFKGEAGFHPDEQTILREMLGWGFVDIFRKYQTGRHQYTFWDYRIPNALKRKMGWRIDYILASLPLAEKSISARIDTEPRLRERPSDHTFLVAEFDI